ncbi:hypothetical protein [Shewanella gaetbuli]
MKATLVNSKQASASTQHNQHVINNKNAVTGSLNQPAASSESTTSTTLQKAAVNSGVESTLIATNQLQAVKLTTSGQPSQIATVTIANQPYEVALTHEQQKLLQTVAKVAITADAISTLKQQLPQLTTPAVSQSATGNQAVLATQLVLLAQSIQTKLPASLMALASQNGVSSNELVKLASRSQGYPLPTATINNNQMTFADGPTIKLDSANLAKGQYLASIVYLNKSLLLTLTPVKAEINVNLTPSTKSPLATTTDNNASLIITKPEPSQILSQLFKKLEATSINPNVTSADLKGQSQLSNPQATQANQTSQTAQASLAKSADTLLNPLQQYIAKSPQTNNASSGQLEGKTNSAVASSSTSTTANAQTLNLARNQTTIDAATAKVLAKNIASALPQAANTITPPTFNMLEQPKANTTQDTKPLATPIDVLQKALSKAGAMPVEAKVNAQQPQNLAVALLKLLPQLARQPLSELALPSTLTNELASLASINLSQPVNHTSPTQLFTGGAITTLFQLLLGVKAQQSNKTISTKLQYHLQALQKLTASSSSAPAGILGLLDKVAGLDSIHQLASSFQLYQQASSNNDQGVNWYFALPYSLNQKNEQFEGHFQRDKTADGESEQGWRLQLKFNLSQGAVLVNAHKQANQLNLQFKSSNQLLLDKIDGFNDTLAQKISQIGFTPGEFTTQIANIPATLLPGDHFLVKTRA